MDQRDAAAGAAEGAGGAGIILHPDRRGGAAGGPREHRGCENADRDDLGDRPPPPRSAVSITAVSTAGKGEGEVGAAHHRLVGPATACRCQHARGHADRGAQHHGQGGDGHGVLGTDHDHRKNVAAERIRSEPMSGGGPVRAGG